MIKNKSKIIRCFICFVLALSLYLGMTGCKLRSDYQLIDMDGKHYLVFDNFEPYYNDLNQYSPYLCFDSVEEFKGVVTNGVLTVEQKKQTA